MALPQYLFAAVPFDIQNLFYPIRYLDCPERNHDRMEFHEKLQQLRKQRGLTQDELSAQLYVSRTAVSKWESGRGYPSIDSLKAIAAFFHVTIDDLLSGEELLTAAEEAQNRHIAHLRSRIFSAIDISTVLLFFLPFFAQSADGAVQSVSLLSLTGIQPYVKIVYSGWIVISVFLGILMLLFHNHLPSGLEHSKHRISLILHALGVLLFILSPQPYAAVFLFSTLAIKAFLMIKIP